MLHTGEKGGQEKRLMCWLQWSDMELKLILFPSPPLVALHLKLHFDVKNPPAVICI